MAIVPKSFDNAIVTQEFLVYEVDQDELDPHYLKLVLRSKYFRRAIRAITTGHSNRRRTQAGDFENLTIFVPEEERAQPKISDLVGRASEEVAMKTDEYRSLLGRFDQLMTGELSLDGFLGRRRGAGPAAVQKGKAK